MSKKLPCLLAILLTAVAAADDDIRIQSLAWLAGCWAAVGAEPGSVEHWLPPAGGTMLGVARTVRDGRTRGFEFLRIAETDDGSLILVAMPSGQPPATFRLDAIGPEEVAFANPEHDFPQRIVYRRLNQDELLGRIEGETNDGMQQINFPMTRVDCDDR